MRIGVWLIASLLLMVAGVDSFAARLPEVPAGHPRLLIREADRPSLEEKVRRAELPKRAPLHDAVLADYWRTIKRRAAAGTKAPQFEALVYLATGDIREGREAIQHALAALRTAPAGDNSNSRRKAFEAAMVYDWVYDHPDMSASRRREFATELKRLLAGFAPGLPDNPTTRAITGHAQGWIALQLWAGIALYDEAPEIYDGVRELVEKKYLPARAYLFKSGMHFQGHYSKLHHHFELLVYAALSKIGGAQLMPPETAQVLYRWAYLEQPGNNRMHRGGDDAMWLAGQWDGWSQRTVMEAAALHGDPYLLELADGGYFTRTADGVAVAFVLRSLATESRPLEELPLTRYFPDPMGEMVARSAWNIKSGTAPATTQMRIGGYYFGNHQRKDWGTFQIYYKGPLAIVSGGYDCGKYGAYGSEHWRNYAHRTIAHNGLLIHDPNEVVPRLHGKPVTNDGGALYPKRHEPKTLDSLFDPVNRQRLGRVSAHGFGPDPRVPEYSYIAGELTMGYSAHKVDLVTRSMVSLNTGDSTYPLALVVFDRIDATSASYRKRWLLHSVQEPRVSGSSVVIERNTDGYHGKLVSENLLPVSTIIEKVGGPGREFWVNDRNFECEADRRRTGAWRIEISPSRAQRSDRFLNVLTVMDASTDSGPGVKRLESGNLVGAEILDRVVLFSNDGRLMRSARFTLGGEGQRKLLVCALEPGTWTVNRTGAPHATREASQDERCIYFQGGPGSYELSR